jgi:hypothetical protein
MTDFRSSRHADPDGYRGEASLEVQEKDDFDQKG